MVCISLGSLVVVTLNNLPLNTQGVIISNPNDSLHELGFMVGAKVAIIARAVFDGPIAVRVESSTFAVRKEEVEEIYVEIVQ